AQKQLIQDAIKAGDADFAAVARAIHDTDALDYTRQAAVAEAGLARQAIADYPPSAYRETLLKFCTFAVERDH
ncbi:MAG: octaprenyl diphosphate synthase, partial [Paralcaligenes sp.]